MPARWFRSLMVPVAVAALLFPGPASSRAGVETISGESPHDAGCDPLDPTPFAQPKDAEAEITLAVNPTDPANVIVAWMQDGGAGIVTVATHDGGRSWTEPMIVPGLSFCSGGEFLLAADPWLSIGPDGTVYLSSLSLDPHRTRLQVSTSSDGGTSWSRPHRVFDGAITAHDMPRITAHPTKACVAYLAWIEQSNIFVTDPGDLAVLSSRTDDCGEEWSLPESVIVRSFQPRLPSEVLVDPVDGRPSIEGGPRAPEILVLSDGSLLLLVTSRGTDGEEFLYRLLVSRSEDGGRSWSAPVAATEFSPGPERHATDPEATGKCRFPPVIGEPVPCPIGTARHWASGDVAPDGTVHISFYHQTEQGHSQIRVVSSTDEPWDEITGPRWGDPVVVSQGPAEKFLPSLAIAGDGTVGITYYDMRNDELSQDGDPSDEPLTADVYFAWSRDAGRSWNERPLAGSFDLRATVFFRDELWVGEYHGLDGQPYGFAAAFALADPFAEFGATDTFFTKIR